MDGGWGGGVETTCPVSQSARYKSSEPPHHGETLAFKKPEPNEMPVGARGTSNTSPSLPKAPKYTVYRFQGLHSLLFKNTN